VSAIDFWCKYNDFFFNAPNFPRFLSKKIGFSHSTGGLGGISDGKSRSDPLDGRFPTGNPMNQDSAATFPMGNLMNRGGTATFPTRNPMNQDSAATFPMGNPMNQDSAARFLPRNQPHTPWKPDFR
jgi:hypothetical protein